MAILSQSLISFSEGITSFASIDKMAVDNLFMILEKIGDLSHITLNQNFVKFIGDFFHQLPILATAVDRMKNLNKVAVPFSIFMGGVVSLIDSVEEMKAKTTNLFSTFILKFGKGIKDMSKGLLVFVKMKPSQATNMIKTLVKIFNIQKLVHMNPTNMKEMGKFMDMFGGGIAF